MSTNCKIIIGYTDHMDNWCTTKEYVRWMDGYTEAIKPLLLKYGKDVVEKVNETAEYDSWKFDELTGPMDCEYQYYLDISDNGDIRCTIIEWDNEFLSKYGVISYKVSEEFIIK